jgi:VanZ family protein
MTTWLRYWGPVCGYAGLIFYLSSQSHPEDNLPSLLGLLSDKVLHVAEYAVLGGLCYVAFRYGTGDRLRPWAGLLAVLLTSLYGLSDEIHQSFVPFRESSGLDWLADTIGAAASVVVASRLAALWPANSDEAIRERP